ncbi:hypothetical protein [Wolbachia endosymbiont of Psylliodes chrysocephala]|uniref:hypothetical protein n=1 Tax=Wolbachia endosymbiont of Psylliodes chrysocephala TaxID=2883236 RepID=UPI0020A0EB5C|nr:hypothetical protein [Wolbachia endosymbiont of Psylliodes chrysocephala]
MYSKRCHSSSSFSRHLSSLLLVIPVPRHWDPASFFLDPSVSYSDDTLTIVIPPRYLLAANT